LEDEAYLARAEGSRKYVPGAGLIALASVVVGGVDVRGAARPLLERIAELTGETVTLHVPSHSQRICVEGVESLRSVRRAVVLGHIAPLYEGSTGRAILAHLDSVRIAAVLAEAVRNGIDAKSLEAELPAIRAAGYVARLKERDGSRIGAIAVPVFNARGVCASITVAGPSDRLTLNVIHEAAPAIKKECAALSASLGFAPQGAVS
jgi:DNA-binding IclR family transcriptional regulator